MWYLGVYRINPIIYVIGFGIVGAILGGVEFKRRGNDPGAGMALGMFIGFMVLPVLLVLFRRYL